MRKELIIAVIISACLIAGFIASVIITEQRNIENIRDSYKQSAQEVNVHKVAIPAPSEDAIHYQKSKVVIWIVSLLMSMLIPVLFLVFGLSSGIRKWAQTRSSQAIIVIIIYFIVYSLITYLINLPIDYYSGFIRKHAYGLSNQTFMKWIGDSLKSLAISTVAGAIVIWIPYAIIKKSPAYWWLFTGLLSIPVLFFVTYISPLYIDPLFNKYETVSDRTLEAKIHEQLNRTIIEDCQVLQVNKSVDTKEMNAYMTGVLNTKRIVLWDTTINKLNDREVLSVTAHEMGHYLMGHVWKSIILGGLFCILALFLVNKSALWVIEKSGGTFGFSKLYDIASLPLLILLINIFMFISAPVTNGYSRYIEKEADRFELELTMDNYASATSTVKLHQESLTLPQPGVIYKLWNYDHPTFKERVDFANSYKPWRENKPLKYQKFIH